MMAKFQYDETYTQATDYFDSVKEMCFFLANLLHPKIKLLHMPSCEYWNQQNKLHFRHLMKVIGTQCSGLVTLRFVSNRSSKYDAPPSLTATTWYGRAFFKALPRLSSLRVVELPFYKCDNWALIQFGEYGHSIV